MDTPTEIHSGPSMPEEGSNETVFVPNLGRFSMKEVYEALVSNIASEARRDPLELQQTISMDTNLDDSDCSWTVEEERGEFYVEMRRRLDEFVLSDETTITTDMLSRHQRRFVHATAKIMSLGHASLGPPREKQRAMIIYKTPRGAIPEVTQDPHSRGISWACLDDTLSPPVPSIASHRKRQRLEKLKGGYPCSFYPCSKIFDRASERNKHEQAHQPAFKNRYQCTICSKGFRYPKDLLRHTTRVHENAASRPIFDPTYASIGASTFSSGLTFESRRPSETSLNFNSNPASRINSPALFGLPNPDSTSQKAIMEFIPLLDDPKSYPSLFPDEDLNLPFQELADFDFDQHDLGEDAYLEMRVK